MAYDLESVAIKRVLVFVTTDVRDVKADGNSGTRLQLFRDRSAGECGSVAVSVKVFRLLIRPIGEGRKSALLPNIVGSRRSAVIRVIVVVEDRVADMVRTGRGLRNDGRVDGRVGSESGLVDDVCGSHVDGVWLCCRSGSTTTRRLVTRNVLLADKGEMGEQ